MTRIALIAALVLTGSTASANYGDVDMQIENAKFDAPTLTQVLVQPEAQVATAGTCRLSQEHLVSVPADFVSEPGISMACLEQ